MDIEIREGTILEAVQISRQIPEFDEPPNEPEYSKRFDGVDHIIFLATAANRLLGFKAGYDRHQDGVRFYSWMGGVRPEYRRLGVAGRLQQSLEKWCLQRGYKALQFKTRNQHRNMICFAMKHNFNLVGFKEKKHLEEHRLIFEKPLLYPPEK